MSSYTAIEKSNINVVASPQNKTFRVSVFRRVLQLCAAVALYLGLLICLASMFRLTGVITIPALAGGVYLLQYFFLQERPRIRRVVFALTAVSVCIVFITAYQSWTNGLLQTVNQISYIWGTHTGNALPVYQISVYAAEDLFGSIIFLCCISLIIAIPCAYTVDRNSRAGCLILVFPVALLQMVGRLVPAWYSALLLIAGICLLFYIALCKPGLPEQSDSAHQQRAVFSYGMSLLMIVILSFSLVYAITPQSIYQKPGFVYRISTAAQGVLHTVRFGANNAYPLVKGNLSEADGFSPQGLTALEIVMSTPTSTYLRGFVGVDFIEDRWTGPDNAAIYNNHALFYWLHRGGFSSLGQLDLLQMVSDPYAREAMLYDLHIRHVGVDRSILFTPYEFSGIPASVAQTRSPLDIGLRAGNLFGLGAYSFTVCGDIVSDYPALASAYYYLLTAGHKTEATMSYLINESHYNRFVYQNFTALPPDIRQLLSRYLEVDELYADTRVSYEFARNSILKALENIAYSPYAPALPQGSGFMPFFLEQSREGYSVHFATAATLMYRFYGIPARYVEGFLITPEDASLMIPGMPFAVLDTRAHAWTEIYLDGVGWIPMEFTPPYMNVMAEPNYDQLAAPPDIPQIGDAPISGEQQVQPDRMEALEYPAIEIEQVVANIAQILLIVLVALVFTVVLVLLGRIIYRRFKLKKERRSFSDPNTNVAICSMFRYCDRLILHLNLIGKDEIVPSSLNQSHKQHYQTARSTALEAAFSNHSMTEDSREFMARFLVATEQRAEKTTSLVKRLKLKYIDFIKY